MKLLSVLPLLAVASCLPIYANIRVVKVNSDGITSVKDYKNVNLDGVDSLEQLKIAPEFQHLDRSKPHGVEPKSSKHCGGKKGRYGLKKSGHHKAEPKFEANGNGVVVGPFKTYEEVKEFTNNLVHDQEAKQVDSNTWNIGENAYVQSTKNWANELVQDVKEIDFKQSFKNIASDNDALLAVGAGVLSGVFLYCIIYLVYLRKLAFDSQFEDYEAAPGAIAVPPEFTDEKLPFYEEKE